MLKLNMQNIYIDEDWVVQQYLNMERNKEWDEMETMNDEKVPELELLWYADDRGIPVDDLQLADGNDSKDIFKWMMWKLNNQLLLLQRSQMMCTAVPLVTIAPLSWTLPRLSNLA
jgi:hypothetical protein